MGVCNTLQMNGYDDALICSVYTMCKNVICKFKFVLI
ncbi:hypothetical protein COLO4_08836 [Corchorus olitorius]|uniref:Uncharacterized protein n=1 Tax=Corchorus olitorius TaxID=93759 RepID=A0A1R3KED5_9ROSI|nr:hypothetical protein COLO4_08836 [Corchorus olitorius]